MNISSKYARSTLKANSLKSLSALALAVIAVFSGAPPASAAPILGSNLASFAVLAATGVTSGGTGSTIGGNLGSAVNPSLTGIYSFTFGSLQPNTGIAQLAQTELDAAILAVNAFTADFTIADGSLDAWQSSHGGVISPGTYVVGAATPNLVGNLVLDGGGDLTAQWHFLFSSTLITGTNSNVSVQGVGDGSGVGIYWTVDTAATLNGPTFAGNVLANTLISSDGNLTMSCGRLLSAESQVTLINDNISLGCAGFATSGGFDQGNPYTGAPSQGVPEPATLALLGLGLAGLGFARRRLG